MKFENGKLIFRGLKLKKIECSFLLYVHVVALVGILMMFFQTGEVLKKTILWWVILHVVGGFGITVGVHRLWAHKGYVAKPFMRTILMLCNCIAFQGSIFHWSRDHRLHHKFSDTELDPHSMSRGFFFSHCGWLLVEKSEELVKQGRLINMKDLQQDKIVMFQKKNYYLLSFFMCFILPVILGQYFVGGSIIYSFCTLSCLRYVVTLNATWCVNSVCHMFGTRPFNGDILPADNWFVSVIALGEGWHNYHHKYPRDWRASKDEWWMINPSATLIRLFRLIGQADTSEKALKFSQQVY